MIVTILNFVSFHVKCSLYQVEMGCKMFPHKTVISFLEFKNNSPCNYLLFPQCISLIFWVHVFQMLWPIFLLFQSFWCVSWEMYYNWQHGHVDYWSRYANSSATWAKVMLYMRSDVSCQLLRESQKGGQYDWCCYQLYFVWFGYNLAHSGNWQFNNSQTGCKIRWSGDWCYLPERRPKWQWPVILWSALNCVCFRYKVVHSGNWQIWK